MLLNQVFVLYELKFNLFLRTLFIPILANHVLLILTFKKFIYKKYYYMNSLGNFLTQVGVIQDVLYLYCFDRLAAT